MTPDKQAIDADDMEIIIRLFEDQKLESRRWQSHTEPAEPFLLIRYKEGNC